MKLALPLALLSLSIPLQAPALAQDLFEGPHWPLPGTSVSVRGPADMNQDGRPDLLFTTLVPDRLGYLPSLGFGRFGAPVLASSTVPSSAPAAGDFTSDGIPDLLSIVQGAVRVHPTGPGGTLGAPIATAIHGQPVAALGSSRSPLAVDLDLDGKLDVVFDNKSSGRLSFLLGDGAGGFGAQTDLSLGAGAVHEVATGLLNNDPWPDLVCSRRQTQAMGISVFLSTGPATFAAPLQHVSGPGTAYGVDVADFTGDALADVAFVNTGRIEVYANSGNGTLIPLAPIGPPNASAWVAIEDMDEDGLADLVFSSGIGRVRVAPGLGGGAFAAGSEFFVGSIGSEGLVLDVNADGHLDVARSANGIAVAYGDGTGALRSASELGVPADAMAQGDLDHDGLADLVLVHDSDLRVLLRLAGGGFAPPVSYASSSTILDVAIGRIDGDPHLDVVITLMNPKVIVLLGDGLGGLGAPIETPLQDASWTIALGDLDGDGIDDLIVMPRPSWPGTPSFVNVRLGTGTGTFGAPIATDAAPYPRDPQVADIDNDGDLDVGLAQGPGVHDTFLLNDGTGHLTKMLYPPSVNTYDLRWTDVNGDGIVDMLGAGQATEIRIGSGGGNFAPPIVIPGLATYVDAGDVTGDGIVDVVSTLSTGYFTVHPGLGGGAFGAASSYHTLGDVEPELIDVDLDGRLDVIVGWDTTLVHLARDPHAEPSVHCRAKTNSLGCVPSIGWFGVSSAGSSSGFTVRATQVRNRKAGMLLYGISGRAETPFSGGSLCVRPPVKRSFGLTSGGSPSGNDCTGVYAIDMNAFAAGALGGNPIPALSIPGTAVTCQFWGRDPGFPSPNDTTLSDALEYLVEQ